MIAQPWRHHFYPWEFTSWWICWYPKRGYELNFCSHVDHLLNKMPKYLRDCCVTFLSLQGKLAIVTLDTYNLINVAEFYLTTSANFIRGKFYHGWLMAIDILWDKDFLKRVILVCFLSFDCATTQGGATVCSFLLPCSSMSARQANMQTAMSLRSGMFHNLGIQINFL